MMAEFFQSLNTLIVLAQVILNVDLRQSDQSFQRLMKVKHPSYTRSDTDFKKTAHTYPVIFLVAVLLIVARFTAVCHFRAEASCWDGQLKSLFTHTHTHTHTCTDSNGSAQPERQGLAGSISPSWWYGNKEQPSVTALGLARHMHAHDINTALTLSHMFGDRVHGGRRVNVR